jgi:hypothetical protein
MTPLDNQLHRALGPDFLQQSMSSVFHSAPAPISLNRSGLSLGATHSGGLPKSHYQKPVEPFLPEPRSATGSCHIKPTCLLNDDANPVNGRRDPSYQRDPWAMRECLMLQAAAGRPLPEAFRKSAKDVVASQNTRKASTARRKYPGKFKCPIDGCEDDFTRKHNLDSG